MQGNDPIATASLVRAMRVAQAAQAYVGSVIHQLAGAMLIEADASEWLKDAGLPLRKSAKISTQRRKSRLEMFRQCWRSSLSILICSW